MFPTEAAFKHSEAEVVTIMRLSEGTGELFDEF